MSNSFLKSFESIPSSEKINFTRHLSIVIKSGLPVVEGLRIIRKQPNSKLLGKIIDRLIADVNNGRFLADSLKNYQHVFGDFFISIVQVGEASGTLSENLRYLSDELKKEQDLRARVRSAMIYPVILLVMTLAVSGFLTFFIFPKLITAFAALNVKLPLATRVLITTLAFLRSYYLILAGAAVGLFFAMRFAMRADSVRYFLHRLMLYTPVLSGLVMDVNMASITRVLWILLKGGMRIVESLSITGDTLENLVYKRAFKKYTEGVRRGEQLGVLLAKDGNIFPPILTSMIEIGENTGNLEENLLYLSTYYADEVDTSLKDFVAVLEPLILVFMGLMVGFVAIAIVTPIYSISQGISQ